MREGERNEGNASISNLGNRLALLLGNRGNTGDGANLGGKTNNLSPVCIIFTKGIIGVKSQVSEGIAFFKT